MEIGKWKKRKHTPTWGDNHLEEEPAVVVFLPPNVGWMGKWRELALNAPSVSIEDDVDPETVKKVAEWGKDIEGFRTDLITELVLAVDNLTLDGKSISREEAIEFILDNEGLRDELFTAILAQGTVSAPEKKA